MNDKTTGTLATPRNRRYYRLRVALMTMIALGAVCLVSSDTECGPHGPAAADDTVDKEAREAARDLLVIDDRWWRVRMKGLTRNRCNY